LHSAAAARIALTIDDIVAYRVPIVTTSSILQSIVAAGLVTTLLTVVPASAACTGDCNGDGSVSIDELILGVRIALGLSPLASCTAFDANGDLMVSIGELVQATGASLDHCPAPPSPTATSVPTETPTVEPSATASPTATPSMTPTVNLPPILPTASVYRTYPGFDIVLPLGATDPEGLGVSCTADDLPAGASFDTPSGVFSWKPADDQLGAFYVPFSCSDAAAPPASADGQLIFRVSAVDPCVTPTCDPATGCTSTLPPLDQSCCDAGPVARVAEPFAGCPEGRVLHIGQNSDGTFGRLQNCDVLHMRNFAQSSAEVDFNVETRCVNTLNRVQVYTHLEGVTANHPNGVLIDTFSPQFFLAEDPDGFDRQVGRRFPLTRGTDGTFKDLEGIEANLTVTLSDSDNTSVTEQLRVRLSFTPGATELPDVDPTLTPLPTCAPDVTPAPGQTPSCGLPAPTPTPEITNG
jgi:hypothetical protein